MTVTAAPSLARARQVVARELTDAETAIDVVRLDRALRDAKNEVDAAIHDETVRAVELWISQGGSPRLRVTREMLAPLEQLHDLGREEARLELERLGYQLPARALIEERPGGPDDLAGYLGRNLGAIEVRIEDELVRADLAGLSRGALAQALLEIPGGRDIASRIVSTALIGGLAGTFTDHADLVPAWQYTAILDGGTCDQCRPLDGTTYQTLDELFRVLPNFGPNPRCLGGGRCRCRAVPVPAPDTPATLPARAAVFDLPDDTGDTIAEINRAIGVIESVHRLDTHAPARVVLDPSLSPDTPAFYDPATVEIHVLPGMANAASTFIHEVGHYLSHQGIGDPRLMAARSADLHGWLDAVANTPQLQQLILLTRVQEVPVMLPNGQRGLVPVDHVWLDYMLEAEEVWARSYAQWIALRSGDARLAADLAHRSGGIYPEQWLAADFEPVAAAIDELMRRLGWRP